MLTISQLAAYAGVTVRAVRHYHAKGLLPEPERDASGYRRYDARAVVELVRIRTLADAGVPLARVRELLHAGDDEFAAAVREIDAQLRADIRERQRHRDRLARLATGDTLAVPPEVVEYLGRLRALGVSERVLDTERDSWILIAAHAPDRIAEYMEEKGRQLDDPRTVQLYRALDEAVDWEPDDPRLPALADWLAAYIADVAGEDYAAEEQLAAGFAELLDSVFLDAVPVAERLLELLEERGWSGWTQLKPVDG